MSVTYDAGALIFARHRQAVSRGFVPVVPAPVIWQVWHDGLRQVRLARFLKGCWIEPVDDELARTAGVLLGRAGTINGEAVAVLFDEHELVELRVTAERPPRRYRDWIVCDFGTMLAAKLGIWVLSVSERSLHSATGGRADQ